MFEALTDLYAILPLGVSKDGKRAMPLLRKSKPAKPGLTGEALDRAVARFIQRVPHARGARVN